MQFHNVQQNIFFLSYDNSDRLKTGSESSQSILLINRDEQENEQFNRLYLKL